MKAYFESFHSIPKDECYNRNKLQNYMQLVKY